MPKGHGVTVRCVTNSAHPPRWSWAESNRRLEILAHNSFTQFCMLLGLHTLTSCNRFYISAPIRKCYNSNKISTLPTQGQECNTSVFVPQGLQKYTLHLFWSLQARQPLHNCLRLYLRFGFNDATRAKLCIHIPIDTSATPQRRQKDSNLRYTCAYCGLAIHRLKPISAISTYMLAFHLDHQTQDTLRIELHGYSA